jgi:hypothetical protein
VLAIVVEFVGTCVTVVGVPAEVIDAEAVVDEGITGVADVPEGVPQLIPCTQQRGAWLNTWQTAL